LAFDRAPDPFEQQIRRQTDQALGGMDCWAGDPLDTYQIAQPSGPERWQVLLGAVICVAAVLAIGWWMV